MRNAALLSMLMLAGTGTTAAAGIPEPVASHVPQAIEVGRGRYSYLWFDAYDAVLYAPADGWSLRTPFVLELRYLRAIDGEDIAERTIKELRKQEFDDELKLAAWFAELRRIFPDVEDGTRLLGLYTPGGPTAFHNGTQQIGVVRDPAFGPWFFNIWLGVKTTAPELRRQLLGLE